MKCKNFLFLKGLLLVAVAMMLVLYQLQHILARNDGVISDPKPEIHFLTSLQPNSSQDQSSIDHPRQQLQDSRVANLRSTFVMVLSFHGQQGSGTLCLSAFQCFLSSIYQHFHVVEPYLVNSHLQSYIITDKPWLTFGSLFNFKFFNSESQKYGYAEMVSLKEFERTTSNYKYIIYVLPGGTSKVAWSANKTGNKVNCFEDEDIPNIVEPYRTHIKNARGKLEGVKSEKCIVRVIELRTTRRIIPSISTVSSVFKIIFDTWSPQDVMLVFPSWPKVYVPVFKPLNGINCLQKHLDSRGYLQSQFQPSKRLIQDAENYEKRFLGNANKLAIMLRVERVVRQYLKEVQRTQINKPKTIQDCFQRVLALKSEIKNRTNFSNPLVTLDMGGKYGTDSINNKNIEALSIKTLESLYNNEWSMAQWENSFVEAAGGETHRGYIAALQRLLASRADCLVLVGGGDFQALAVQDYFEYHKSGPACIHLVCCMSSFDVKGIKNNLVDS